MSLSQNSSSVLSNKQVNFDAIDNVDRISKLPNDILHKIISELSTEEAIKTCILSKRWVDTWKQMSYLCFDMRKTITINGINLPLLLDRAAKLMTKIINNHNGHLETGVIFHYTYQLEDGMVASWIQSLTSVKHTKNLILANFNGRHVPTVEANVLKLSPKAFYHPKLRTLSLYQYILQDAHAFNGCRNLKHLELFHIFGEVGVFNNIIMSCPSLEVLLLQIFFNSPDGHLKIDHKKLRVLFMSCNQIDSIQVYATRLDILSIEFILCEKDNVLLEIPRLPFRRNYWVAGQLFPHTSINISGPAQEKESNGMVMWPLRYVTRPASLSVSVNLKNPREVEMLREILDVWTTQMIELEISFKNIEEEGNSSNGGALNKLWEKAEPFPNAEFRVDTVWMHNFSGSNEEEFALASRLVMQKTVMRKMMIKTSAFPNKKKRAIQGAVAKLKELPKGNKELKIEYF